MCVGYNMYIICVCACVYICVCMLCTYKYYIYLALFHFRCNVGHCHCDQPWVVVRKIVPWKEGVGWVGSKARPRMDGWKEGRCIKWYFHMRSRMWKRAARSGDTGHTRYVWRGVFSWPRYRR